MLNFIKNIVWVIRQVFDRKPGNYDGAWEDFERTERDYHEYWEDLEEDDKIGGI